MNAKSGSSREFALNEKHGKEGPEAVSALVHQQDPSSKPLSWSFDVFVVVVPRLPH